MNFDHVNKISDYCRDQIMPHLSNRVQITDFGHYLTKLSEHSNFKWMRQELRAYPLTYLVDPVLFVKKYSKKCVSYMGTASPQDGSMNIVYQISPTLHVLARLFQWIEHDAAKAYLTVTCAFRTHEEYLDFFDNNRDIRLTGNTEDERIAGFNAQLPSNGVGLGALIQKRLQSGEEKEETP